MSTIRRYTTISRITIYRTKSTTTINAVNSRSCSIKSTYRNIRCLFYKSIATFTTTINITSNRSTNNINISTTSNNTRSISTSIDITRYSSPTHSNSNIRSNIRIIHFILITTTINTTINITIQNSYFRLCSRITTTNTSHTIITPTINTIFNSTILINNNIRIIIRTYS